jgi:hypothetical protein
MHRALVQALVTAQQLAVFVVRIVAPLDRVPVRRRCKRLNQAFDHRFQVIERERSQVDPSIGQAAAVDFEE